jgi:hypothetical protein
VDLYGLDEVVEWATELLAGARPRADSLPGGPRADSLPGGPRAGFDVRLLGGDPDWESYWFRVWGTRTFLYVWAPQAEAPVIAGLDDPHWRVREMCAKVCRLREIAEAAPGLVRLAGDPAERVRVAALKAIGDICEADSAAPLLGLAGRQGREADVAATALRRMEERLDRTELGCGE